MKITAKKRRKNSTSGSTMVEVLIAFLVVMVMIVMFSRVVLTSSKMLVTSQKMIEKNESFNAGYYKTANQAGRAEAGRPQPEPGCGCGKDCGGE